MGRGAGRAVAPLGALRDALALVGSQLSGGFLAQKLLALVAFGEGERAFRGGVMLIDRVEQLFGGRIGCAGIGGDGVLPRLGRGDGLGRARRSVQKVFDFLLGECEQILFQESSLCGTANMLRVYLRRRLQ